MIFSNLTAIQLNDFKEKVVLLPLGAIEQHGTHLAVATDTDIVTEIAIAVESLLKKDLVLCPTLPFGSSHHHLLFGGTISVSPINYTNVLVDIVSAIIDSGFRRVVLLNGHGGNIIPGKQALLVLSDKYDQTINPNIVLATYWELAGKAFAGEPPMQSPALSHACEYETSLMLHIHPKKVFRDNIKRSQRPASNGYIPWEDDEPYRGVTMVKSTPYISDIGCSGEPSLATKEKGEYLFNAAVTSLIDFIKSFKDWPYLKKLYEKNF